MSGIYFIACFIAGTIFGLSIYHFCMRSAMKINYQIDNHELPGVDTGQVSQEYAE